MSEFITQEDIEALLDRKLEAVLEKVSANVARQLETHTDRIGEVVSKGSSSFLDSLIEEADELEDDEDEDDDEDDDDDFDYSDDDEDEPTVTRDPEVARLKREVDAFKAQAAEEKTAREQAETKQKQDALRNSTIEALTKTGKVVNPSQFLKLLEVEGQITEKDGQYVVKGKDQYGDTYTPVSEAIDGFLSADYANFAPSRPGTGTGTDRAASQGYSGGMKYFNPDGSSKVDPGVAMESDRKGYLAELNQVQG